MCGIDRNALDRFIPTPDLTIRIFLMSKVDLAQILQIWQIRRFLAQPRWALWRRDGWRRTAIIAHRRMMFLSCIVYHPWNPFKYQHVSIAYVLSVCLPIALGSAGAVRVASATAREAQLNFEHQGPCSFKILRGNKCGPEPSHASPVTDSQTL